MGNMFSECDSLVSLDISNWDTSNVVNMGDMFSDCSSLTTINGVIDMKYCFNCCNMFNGCYNLAGVEIKNPPFDFDSAGLTSSQYEIVS